MARTVTADERSAIGSSHHVCAAKLELENPDGSYQDMSSYGGYDWLIACTLSEDIDDNTMRFQAVLWRDHAGGTSSLAPFREDSTLNVDSGAAYAPFLDIGRKWKLSVSVQEYGTAHAYTAIGEGYIDKVSVGDAPSTIAVQGRGLDWSMQDAWIVGPDEYSAAGSDSMETVIQDLLDDHLPTSPPTLETPVSPSFVMNPVTFEGIALMDAIQRCAKLAGFVVRYRYDSSDALEFTLYEPDRTATSGDEDWTLESDEYTAVPLHEIDIANIRNNISVKYWDDTAEAVTTHTETDATSVTRYGGAHAIPRTLEIDLAKETNITTAARANSLAEDVLSDLKEPAVMEELVVPGFWPVQLGDYIKLPGNGIHSDQDRFAAVTRYTQSFQNGKLTTRIGLRGQPAARYRTWVRDGQATHGQIIRPTILRLDRVSETATQLVVRARPISPRNGQTVKLTVDAGGLTVSPTDATVSATTDLATTGTQDFTITRPSADTNPRRVSFTADAGGSSESTDGVDVLPQLLHTGSFSGTLTTTAQTVVSYTVPTDKVVLLELRLIGRAQSGGGLLDHRVIHCSVQNVGGTLTLGDETAVSTSPTITAYIDTVDTSGTSVRLRVAKASGSADVDFTGSIEALIVQDA